MKSPLLNASLGLLLLSFAVAIIGRWFPKISSEVATPIIYAGGLVFVGLAAFGGAKMEGAALAYPTLWGALAIAACGAMLGYGDYFSIKALNAGGSVLLVSAVISLVPVVSGLLMIMFGGAVPNARQWVAVTLAVASALVFRSDPSLREAPPETPVEQAQQQEQ